MCVFFGYNLKVISGRNNNESSRHTVYRDGKHVYKFEKKTDTNTRKSWILLTESQNNYTWIKTPIKKSLTNSTICDKLWYC